MQVLINNCSPNSALSFTSCTHLLDKYFRFFCSYCYAQPKERVRMKVRMVVGMRDHEAPPPPRHCLFPWKRMVHLRLEQTKKEETTPVREEGVKSLLFYEGCHVHPCRRALSCVSMMPQRVGNDSGAFACCLIQRHRSVGEEARGGAWKGVALCIHSCLGATMNTVTDKNVVAEAAHWSHSGASLLLDKCSHSSLCR